MMALSERFSWPPLKSNGHIGRASWSSSGWASPFEAMCALAYGLLGTILDGVAKAEAQRIAQRKIATKILARCMLMSMRKYWHKASTEDVAITWRETQKRSEKRCKACYKSE